MGEIEKRVLEHSDGLDRRVILKPPACVRADAGSARIGPEIGAPAAGGQQCKQLFHPEPLLLDWSR